MPPSNARRAPRQQRSVATVGRLLDAVDRMLADGTWSSATVRDVADRAGLTTGAVYRWFDDRRSIVDALAARYLDELVDVVDELAGRGRGTRAQVVDDLVDGYADFVRRRPGFRGLWLNGHLSGAAVAADRENNRRIARAVGGVLAAVPGEGPAPDALTLEVAVQVADACLTLAFERDPHGDERVLAQLRELLRAQLVTAPG